MVMAKESVAQGVYAPNALSTTLVHTPYDDGLQYQTSGWNAIFFFLPLLFTEKYS